MILNGCDVESEDGSKVWYKDGRCHREDGPAVERADGSKGWFFKGIFVGEGDEPDPALWARLTSTEANGGPLLNGCVVILGGDKRWYKDDLRHREDGPAVERVDGDTRWYINGKYYGWNAKGFWALWGQLTEEQRGNPTLLRWMPR